MGETFNVTADLDNLHLELEVQACLNQTSRVFPTSQEAPCALGSSPSGYSGVDYHDTGIMSKNLLQLVSWTLAHQSSSNRKCLFDSLPLTSSKAVNLACSLNDPSF